MSNNQRDLDKEFWELLKKNYDNLNNAVWEAHKASWTMTGIFVPIISAGLGLFLKEYSNLCEEQIILIVALLFIVIWFWYFMLKNFENYNSPRFIQLKKLEKAFTAYYSNIASNYPFLSSKDTDKNTEFKQYKLPYIGWFDDIAFGLAILLTTLLVFIFLNVLSPRILSLWVIISIILSALCIVLWKFTNSKRKASERLKSIEKGEKGDDSI